MVDLMPATDPGSISYSGINDATNVLLAGRASMMMNWPFMWNAGQDPKQVAGGRKACERRPTGRPGRQRLY